MHEKLTLLASQLRIGDVLLWCSSYESGPHKSMWDELVVGQSRHGRSYTPEYINQHWGGMWFAIKRPNDFQELILTSAELIDGDEITGCRRIDHPERWSVWTDTIVGSVKSINSKESLCQNYSPDRFEFRVVRAGMPSTRVVCACGKSYNAKLGAHVH